MAFTTIHPAPGLTRAERRRAAAAGPPAVATGRDHAELLAAAGLVTIAQLDVSETYLRTARGWLACGNQHADELTELVGQAVFEESQAERRTAIAAIEQGLLVRTLFVAVRPD
jgi:hypothetical protein